MIRRCIALIDQPPSTNRRASQSSRGGLAGRSPRAPKLSVVCTSPWPKCQRQIRLTITRLVSGCAGSVSQRASSSRPLPVALNLGGPDPARTAGTRRGTASPRVRWLPRMWTRTSATRPSVTPIAVGHHGGGRLDLGQGRRATASARPWSPRGRGIRGLSAGQNLGPTSPGAARSLDRSGPRPRPCTRRPASRVPPAEPDRSRRPGSSRATGRPS